MKIAIAIFVKTPGISPVKTRLGKDIGREQANSIYHSMVKHMEEVAYETSLFEKNISLFWAVAEQEGLNHPLWKNLDRVAQNDGDLGDRLYNVYDQLIKKYDAVFLIGADVPGLTSENMLETYRQMHSFDYCLGPDLGGGFYLIGGKKPLTLEFWQSVSYSTSSTYKKMKNNLLEEGSVYTLKPLLDIDTVDDLQQWRSMN